MPANQTKASEKKLAGATRKVVADRNFWKQDNDIKLRPERPPPEEKL
jgi:hypothetical protein